MKLIPTRRTDYGIRALIHLAHHEGTMVKAEAIAEVMDIPKGFLHNVLQILQRGRLVTSRPGRSGGYSLARPATEITMLQIVEGLEGPIDSGGCVMQGGPCHWEEACAVHWVWTSARESFAQSLSAATLARVAADDRALAEGRTEIHPAAHRGTADGHSASGTSD